MAKQVIILIGLKGSGKTYVGTLMQEKMGVDFFRVEDVWLSIKSERLSNEYLIEGFNKVKKKIDRLLLVKDRITIESTRTTKYFNKFLDKIKVKYDVKLIKINTNPELCIKRIKSRDSSMHISVSDDNINKINQEALKVDMQYDLIIDNEKSSEREIIQLIKKII